MNLDLYIFQQLNNLAGQEKWIGNLAVFFGSYFQYFLIGGISLYIIVRKVTVKNIRLILVGFLAALVSRFVFASLIYHFFFRPRPFVNNQSVYELISQLPSRGSFPSGHMSFLFAFSAVIYAANKKIGWICFSGSFLIGIARVFAGVHYPLDILGGIIIGISIGWITAKIFKIN